MLARLVMKTVHPEFCRLFRRALATTATRSVILVGFGGHNVAVGLIDRTPAAISL